jgi:LEA14-like dessication related protein
MMRFFSSLLVALTLCLASTGCSSLTNLQRPSAAVTGMNLGSADERGFTMNFDVNLTNPNSVALPLAAADYKLGLGGVNVLDGKAKPAGSVPANGSRSVTLPVSVTYENLLSAEQAIRAGGGDVPYDLDGGLSFDTGNPFVGALRVPLRHSGTLPLRQVLNDPQALLRNPAARRLATEVLGGLFRK